MKATKISIACLCSTLLVCILLSCAPSGRKPLNLAPFNQNLSGLPQGNIVIGFEECVPGRPFNQTVWDNISGPSWNTDEANQISFTAKYKPQFFYIPPKTVPLVAKAGINLNDTQIIVPFGNILSGTLESAARKNFSNATLCFDEGCLRSAGADTVLRVKIDQFFVWETPLNYLNLYVKGRSVCSRGGTDAKEHRFEKHLMYQKIGGLASPLSRAVDETVGSLLTTPTMFMDEVNRISNVFAEIVTVEILTKGL